MDSAGEKRFRSSERTDKCASAASEHQAYSKHDSCIAVANL